MDQNITAFKCDCFKALKINSQINLVYFLFDRSRLAQDEDCSGIALTKPEAKRQSIKPIPSKILECHKKAQIYVKDNNKIQHLIKQTQCLTSNKKLLDRQRNRKL